MRKRPSRIAFNSTSMLDVIFIILIFFISVSRLQEGWINIRLPRAKGGERPQDRAKGALVISIDAQDRLMADRTPLAGEPELAAVARTYAQAEGPDAPVLFTADRASTSGTLVASLKTVRDSGLSNISFSYEPKREKP